MTPSGNQCINRSREWLPRHGLGRVRTPLIGAETAHAGVSLRRARGLTRTPNLLIRGMGD
jgi:hypothetical protein